MSDGNAFETELRRRSGNACEMCGAREGLSAVEVSPSLDATSADRWIYECHTCKSQSSGEEELDPPHWFCLREAIWSEVPAVQVVGYRVLKRLQDEGWAQDLIGQVYLMEDVQAWADAETNDVGGERSDEVVTLDSNGTQLLDGDSVTLIKDLDVKGAGFTAKRGTMVRGIHLIGDPDNIEGKVNKITLVLKSKYLKRVI